MDEYKEVLAAKKDSARFDKLYDRYFDAIFNFIYRRTDNEALTADLTSATFLKALQHIGRYKFKGVPFSAWLYRIASNEVNKHFRDHKKRAVFSLEEHIIVRLVGQEEPDPENEEKIAALVAQLQELPTADLAILELRFYEDKNFKEIAYILDISESAAKMRTYRALNKLKVLLKTKDSHVKA